MINGPSAHLSWQELACKDGTPYPQEWRWDRATVLGAAFEIVRAEYGHPIRIVSAYRTPEWNRKIKGAPLSQHMEGRALDMAPTGGRHLKGLIAAVEQVVRQGRAPIRGVGLYPSFVHIDTRPTDRIYRWTGSRKA